MNAAKVSKTVVMFHQKDIGNVPSPVAGLRCFPEDVELAPAAASATSKRLTSVCRLGWEGWLELEESLWSDEGSSESPPVPPVR